MRGREAVQVVQDPMPRDCWTTIGEPRYDVLVLRAGSLHVHTDRPRVYLSVEAH